MTKKLIKTAHFTIEGAFLADFARTRLKEGAYQHSLKILECLEGLPLEEQILILKGEKTLSGINNDILLIPASEEIRQDMKEWHNHAYSNIFSYKSKLYQPYAYVQSWNADDIPRNQSLFSGHSKQIIQDFESDLFDKMYENNLDGFLQSHPHSRSLYYADEPRRDLAFTVSSKDLPSETCLWVDKAVILFREVTEQLPFWSSEYYVKDPLSSVQNLFKFKGHLSCYGAELNHDFTDSDYLIQPTDNDDIEDAYSSSVRDRVEKQQEEYWANYDERVAEYTQKVIDFANNDKEYGWKEFINPDNQEQSIKVPYRAFLHFAVGKAIMKRGFIETQLPPYTPIFPRGMKMGGDNPLHTDAWCGAGLSISDAYEDHTWQNELFYNAIAKCQSLYFDISEFHVLNNAQKKSFTGTIVNIQNYETVPEGQRILVLPHLGVEFDTIARKCDAIITEQGGKLAHLVTIGREFGIPIIRIPNATLHFVSPIKLSFDLENFKMTKVNDVKKLKR